jgi:chromosomal replication initiation ATPase DnaA
MPGPSQLTLALPYAPNYGREDFMPGPSNSAALRLIESWPDWPAPVVLLTGPSGSGKTHLVQIWATLAGAEVVRAATLVAGHAIPRVAPGGALALEDIPPETVPEAGLFHLINSVREVGGSLLLTSQRRADDWCVNLPDLRSRLRLAAPVALGAPEDDLLRQVLVKLFSDRQLVVEKPIIDYLVARMERSLSTAVALVEALDEQALAAGRRITRSMAAAVLTGAAGAAGEFAEQQ